MVVVVVLVVLVVAVVGMEAVVDRSPGTTEEAVDRRVTAATIMGDGVYILRSERNTPESVNGEERERARERQ